MLQAASPTSAQRQPGRLRTPSPSRLSAPAFPTPFLHPLTTLSAAAPSRISTAGSLPQCMPLPPMRMPCHGRSRRTSSMHRGRRARLACHRSAHRLTCRDSNSPGTAGALQRSLRMLMRSRLPRPSPPSSGILAHRPLILCRTSTGRRRIQPCRSSSSSSSSTQAGSRSNSSSSPSTFQLMVAIALHNSLTEMQH